MCRLFIGSKGYEVLMMEYHVASYSIVCHSEHESHACLGHAITIPPMHLPLNHVPSCSFRSCKLASRKQAQGKEVWCASRSFVQGSSSAGIKSQGLRLVAQP